MPTVILIVNCLLSNGQFAFAQHEFVYRGDCDRDRLIVVHQLQAKGATKISAYCLDESAT